jgi:hypothetical protein
MTNMKRTVLGGVILGIALTLSSNVRAQESKASVLLQEGRNKETLDRNFAGAIALYEQALKEAESARDRATTAQALLRLGTAHQRNANISRARGYLEQLVGGGFAGRPEVNDGQRLLDTIRSSQPAGEGVDANSELNDQLVWDDAQINPSGRVAFDGRSLSFVDRRSGSLKVRDLTTGGDRDVVGARNGQIGPSAISRTGREIAYAWRPNAESNDELRMIGTDGGDRWIYSNPAVASFRSIDWTPAGRIAVVASTKDGVSRIALVDRTGGINLLKTFVGFQEPTGVSVSPDGRFIAYDVQLSASKTRGVSILSMEPGFIEYNLPEITDAKVLGWADSSVLLAGERNGTRGVWTIDTVNGRPSNSPPLLIWKLDELIAPLGVSRVGSVYYSGGNSQVRVLDNVLPEIGRLQSAGRKANQQGLDRLSSIQGIVVRWGTGELIAGADVELIRLEGTAASPLNPGAAQAFAALINASPGSGTGPSAEPPRELAPEVQYARTAADGRFIFQNLRPGGYRLAAAHSSEPYVAAQYGQRDPRGPGLLVPLSEAQALRDLKLQMAPTGVISGRVYEAPGRPLSRAYVVASKYIQRDGRRVLVSNFNVFTDDRGDYRLFGLPPARYYVAAKVEDRSEVMIGNNEMVAEYASSPVVTRRTLPDGELVEESHGLVYYGGTLTPDSAHAIDIGPESSSRTGADIVLSTGAVRSYHIRGVFVDGATARPLRGIQIRAVPLKQSPHVDISFAVTDADGAFDLSGVIPGRYAVFSSPPIGGPPNSSMQTTLSAALRGGRPMGISGHIEAEVTNGDIEGLRLEAVAQLNVTGRVVVQGRTNTQGDPELEKVEVSLVWDPEVIGMPNSGVAFLPGAFAVAGANGSFRLQAWPGRYRIRVGGVPLNTYVQSVRMGDVDVLRDGLHVLPGSDSTLEIMLSGRSGVVEGVAVNADNAPMPNVVVALVPEGSDLRQRTDLYKAVATDHSGKFQLTLVPPGSYRLFAWGYAEPGSSQDAEFLRDYEQFGKSIVVTEGKQQAQVNVIQFRR